MEAERCRSPHGIVDGVRQVRDGSRRIAQDDGADVGQIGDRAVVENRPVIVVDKRVLQGIDLHQPGQAHDGGKQKRLGWNPGSRDHVVTTFFVPL